MGGRVRTPDHGSERTASALGRRLSALAPGVTMLSSYRREWLSKDLIAGLVLTALLVPQGMAYAELAGLPAITGLYTSILCLVGYALFGPSRVLVLGPDSSLGPMIAATILPLVASGGDPARAVALGSALALLTGAVTVVAGLAGLGFVADLISKPTMIGYMNGLALTILIGQLPKLFGFSVEGEGFLDDVTGFVRGIGGGETVPAALAVGAVGLVLIVVLQRVFPRLPAVLIVVVLSIGAAALFHLEKRGVDLVGTLPQGFPPLTIPAVTLSDLALLLAGALGIAVVSLADTISTASSFAARSGQVVDGSKEMRGIGAANLAAGLFQGFPVSTSGSRTAVAEQAGARSQVTGLVGAGAITLILLLAPGLLRNLPQPTLAAVVIAASISLADVPGTYGSTVFGGRSSRCVWPPSSASSCSACSPGSRWPSPCRSSMPSAGRGGPIRPSSAEFRVSPGTTTSAAIRKPNDSTDASSSGSTHRSSSPIPERSANRFGGSGVSDPRPKWIIIAAEPITDVDTTAADMLHDLDVSLNDDGVNLVFAEMKDPVRRKVDRYELTRTIDPSHFFPTLEAAVTAFEEESGATWSPPVPPERTTPAPPERTT